MSVAFNPTGGSMVIAYADDSTEVSLPITQPAPTHLAVVNADTAHVIVVNAGFVDGDVDAVVPTSDQNGKGLVVGPLDTAYFALASTRGSESGNLYISVAGVSVTGNVYITPGIADPVVFQGY